jgi:aminopeptidase N
VIEHFGKLEDTLARGLIWDAAWDLTRDAEGSAGDYVALALNGMASEPDSSTIAIAVRNLKTAVDLYAKPENQTRYRQQIATKLMEYALAAPASSDHQLAFVRGLCAFASPGFSLEELVNWYRGSNVPAGLQVDTDLRWTLLNRMVRQGVAAHDEIAAELEIDNSSKGHEESVRLKAAIPTAAAKTAAWESIVDKSDASNAIVENTIAGFNDYENPALHTEFIAKYFAMLPKLWQGDRGYHVAQNITIGLYPMPLVSEELVKATETYLAQSDIEPSAKRFVSEQLANLNRAIAARATD